MISLHCLFLASASESAIVELNSYFTAEDAETLGNAPRLRRLARCYLRSCLAVDLRVGPVGLSFARDANGRLSLRSSEFARIDFSLSHKPGAIVVAISNQQRSPATTPHCIGVDVEPDEVDDAEWLDDAWPITPRDIDWLGGSALGRAAIWTRAEAIYKLSCGIWPDAPMTSFTELTERLGTILPRMWTLSGGAHVVSVATSAANELRVMSDEIRHRDRVLGEQHLGLVGGKAHSRNCF